MRSPALLTIIFILALISAAINLWAFAVTGEQRPLMFAAVSALGAVAVGSALRRLLRNNRPRTG